MSLFRPTPPPSASPEPPRDAQRGGVPLGAVILPSHALDLATLRLSDGSTVWVSSQNKGMGRGGRCEAFLSASSSAAQSRTAALRLGGSPKKFGVIPASHFAPSLSLLM